MSDSKQDPVSALGNNIRDTLERVVSIATSASVSSTPVFDVYRADDKVIISSAPIDGLEATSIEVSMNGKELTVSGKTVDNRGIEPEAFLLRGRTFGAFTKTLVIGVPVIAAEASARVKNSVLTITLPLEASSKSEIIDVQVADD